MKRCTPAAATAALVLTHALASASASASDARGTRGNLGERAYGLPGTGDPVELAETVHCPKDLGSTPRPLVVLLHGWHGTCADPAAAAAGSAVERAGDWDGYAAAGQKLSSGPCAPGRPPSPTTAATTTSARKLPAGASSWSPSAPTASTPPRGPT
ncbi:hypothetical protein Snoj_00950 [Streptomyces nojiriensis]|uniref:Uncharacterized protein n=1 Tax=Streptomyces nojiriensis TaxID=66374 RepID=A0ABQ3SDG9_9ACTN|nr:hypothetical protein [Streptomyces nojiriensis]GGS34506.1 hypothetical protein GCM10010205_75840 [Streptomyces nojiriensis]GHI66177.1 hypothetical protein Snoj_00950 [Streptomyces nojiriensis]